MVYRFFSYSKWHCNWCNFTHEDMKVVVEHEDREHPEKLRENKHVFARKDHTSRY